MTAALEPTASAPPKASRTPAEVAVNSRAQLGNDYVAIPLTSAQERASVLNLCVIARREPDPVQGHLIRRRELLDAKVYLGCIKDAYGLLELVEIWVQDLEGFAESSRAIKLSAESITNASVDDRWRKQFQTGIESWPAATYATGWEVHNPPPTFLDLAQGSPVHPSGPDGLWALCRDDELLKAADLPAYSTSLHRYLHQPRRAKDAPGAPQFVPVLADSPRNPGVTIEYDATMGTAGRLVPFNPGGGLLLVKPTGSIGVEELGRVIGGGTFEGLVHGKTHFRVGPVADVAQALSRGGFLFPGRPDRSASRLVETYLLKMRLLHGLIGEVAAFTRQTQRPLLNLRPSSFAVRLDAGGAVAGLPVLWTARPMLVDGGDAVPLTIPQGDATFRYHVPGRSVTMNIYQPSLVNRQQFEGTGLLLLSGRVDAKPDRRGNTSATFKGTFTTTSNLRPVKHDIIRIRVPVKNTRVDLYVKVDQADQRPGILPFTSVPDERLRPHQSAIEAAIGVPQHEVPFEFYPLLSSACDVYSLAILSVEVLLATPARPLAQALTEFLWFSTSVAQSYKSDAPLIGRVTSVFNSEKRWAELLGPQWLTGDKVAPQQAARFVPPELWMATLAWMVRLLPGHGPDSLQANYGDVSDAGMHVAYDPILAEAAGLVERSRSLLFGEWDVNRRVGALLQSIRHPV